MVAPVRIDAKLNTLILGVIPLAPEGVDGGEGILTANQKGRANL